MGRLTPEFSGYVSSRWLPFLIELVLRPNPSFQPFLKRSSEPDEAFFDYRGRVNVSKLARRISANDIDSDNAAHWERTINRWIYESVAPGPNYIRRTLQSLRCDWVIGLGRSGYQQHAIAMLHALWSLGSRESVTAQARVIFSDSHTMLRDPRAPLRVSRLRLEQFDASAISCGWRDKKRGLLIPTKCTLPRDFPASSYLYAAWMLLDAAILNKHGSLEQRLGAVQDSVAREIDSWLKDVSRTTLPHAKRSTK